MQQIHQCDLCVQRQQYDKVIQIGFGTIFKKKFFFLKYCNAKCASFPETDIGRKHPKSKFIFMTI